MNMHKNARLTPRGRERIVRLVASGQTPEAVAEAAGICPRTVPSGLIDIVGKDWRDCRIAHPGRIGCTVRRPRR
jgi:FixJ family two-component response regulator